MKMVDERSPRLRAWPLMLLAACGSVFESTRPVISTAAAQPSIVSAGERDQPKPQAASPASPPPSEPVMSGLRCDRGVSEDVSLPLPRCPAEMSNIGDYCVDRWEAHVVVRDGDEQRRHPHYLQLAEGVVYEARSAPGMFPQGYINRVQSQAACEAADKRLCTWIEWRRACQGTNWRRFPYGNAYRADTCNHVKVHLFGRLFGHDARRWTQDNFNHPRLNQEPGFLARTGAYDECVSPDDTYDMVGNLHEWVIDRVTVSFMKRLAKEGVYREKQPWRAGNGMFLGGFYSTRGQHGPGCHFTTAAHGPSYNDYSTGFRCCRDARPREQ